MLSGLSSQLGGLIGRKNPEVVEESETGETEIEQSPTSDNNKSRSGSNANESASVLSSVRSQLPSWLGGGGSNNKKESESTDLLVVEGADSSKGHITPDKDSDASSATGGADSEKEHLNVSEGECEKDLQQQQQQQAGLEKVKTLGNFLFTTIKGAGQKIKDTNILLEFQKEHELFLKARGGKGDVVPPWVGHSKEDALKEEVLSLSTDRRNFVRSPPTGVSFAWDFEEMLPIAKAILKDDPNLEKMRYELVPKVISEENFWRNYFYRVTLLKESLSDDSPTTKKQDSIETDEEDAEFEKELNEELKSFEVVEGGSSKVDEKEIDTLLDLK